MEVLKLLINEFAIFSLPSDQESLGDDSLDSGDGQDEIGFSVNATGQDDDATDEDGDDEGCQCNCPSHKKFSDGDDSLENNENIDVVDGDDATDEDSEDEDDDVDSEEDEKQFNFF